MSHMYIIKTSPREKEATADKSEMEMRERPRGELKEKYHVLLRFVLDVIAIDWLDREKKKVQAYLTYRLLRKG